MVLIMEVFSHIAISVVLIGLTLLAISRRKSRLAKWAKENAMVQQGSRFTRVGGGPRLELCLDEQTMGGSDWGHTVGQNLHLTVSATAEVSANLPAGLEIHSARYRGRTESKDVETGDSDLDSRFRICAQDQATARAVFAQTDFANALLNIAMSASDLTLKDGFVTLRFWGGQWTGSDQRPLLDHALNSVILAAHVLACGAEGVPIEGAIGETRPVFTQTPNIEMQPVRLPQPRLPARRAPKG